MMHVHKWNSDIDATEIGRFDPYMDTEGRTGLGFNYSDYILRLSKFRWYCFETRNADQGHAFLTYSATGSTGIIRPNLIRRKIIRKTRFRRWSNFEARKNTIEKNCKKKINEGLRRTTLTCYRYLWYTTATVFRREKAVTVDCWRTWTWFMASLTSH